MPSPRHSGASEKAREAACGQFKHAVELAYDEGGAYGYFGGDVGVTDEDRAKWAAAPTCDAVLNAAHDPALGLDRSGCLRDVRDWLRDEVSVPLMGNGLAAKFEREFGADHA